MTIERQMTPRKINAWDKVKDLNVRVAFAKKFKTRMQEYKKKNPKNSQTKFCNKYKIWTNSYSRIAAGEIIGEWETLYKIDASFVKEGV